MLDLGGGIGATGAALKVAKAVSAGGLADQVADTVAAEVDVTHLRRPQAVD